MTKKEEKALYDKEYYAKNKDKYKEHYEKNKEKKLKRDSDRYYKNKESILKRQRLYRKQNYNSKITKARIEKWLKKNPIKYKCYKKFRKALAQNIIKKRNSCEICYNSPTECHHEDYNKPLEIIELCIRCHRFLHRKYKPTHLNS